MAGRTRALAAPKVEKALQTLLAMKRHQLLALGLCVMVLHVACLGDFLRLFSDFADLSFSCGQDSRWEARDVLETYLPTYLPTSLPSSS